MRPRLYIGIAAAMLSSAAAAFDPPAGYLAGQPPLDYRAVLGEPPAASSAAASAERAGYVAAAAGIGGKAWQAAITQLSPGSPEVSAQIACALGKALSPDTTPATVRLLGNLGADLYGPIEASKALYHRDRPYVGQADTLTCDPRTKAVPSSASLSYAYPSGHAAFGELWARALLQVAPDRAAALTAWGTSVGDNRVACRVHWPSDVAAGRRLADALYARIAATARFKADAAAARAELAGAKAAEGCAG